MNFESILSRLKGLGGAFSTSQLVSMATAFVVVVGVIAGAGWWLNAPTYRVLFADLDPESAGRVAERLRGQDVSFQLAEGGRSVLVPAEQIDQLRLDFAVNGLPSSGRMGFEIFDSLQFGATEFLEQVNFRRALEGEIARTISTIGEVASARVHISMAKDRLFGETSETAKASVVLKLRSSRPLSPATTQGITSLVAAAVEGLRAESVVIMDTNGRSLASPHGDENEPLSGAQLERQQQVEMQLAKRVVDLLEPVVGVGGARANVAVRLHMDSEQRVEERWTDPVIRSRSSTTEGPGGSENVSQNVAGARANLPGPVPPGSNEPTPPTVTQAGTTTTVTTPTRVSETVNNEVGKEMIRIDRPRGGIERLSVAVLIDDEHFAEKGADGAVAQKTRARTPEQLKKLETLVTTAVGVDPMRGDQVSVQNIAFNEPPPEEVVEKTFLERFWPQIVLGLKALVILILGITAFIFVGRPLLGRSGGPARKGSAPVVEAELPKQLPKTIEEIEADLATQLDAGTLQLDRKLPVLTKKLTGLAQKDPEVAARLVRTWLVEDKK